VPPALKGDATTPRNDSDSGSGSGTRDKGGNAINSSSRPAVANVWAEKPPKGIMEARQTLQQQPSSSSTVSSGNTTVLSTGSSGGGDESFMSVQRGRRKSKAAVSSSSSSSTTDNATQQQPSYSSYSNHHTRPSTAVGKPPSSMSLVDAFPQAAGVHVPPSAAPSATATNTSSSTSSRYADAVLRSRVGGGNGGTAPTTAAYSSALTSGTAARKISPNSTYDFPPLSAAMSQPSSGPAASGTSNPSGKRAPVGQVPHAKSKAPLTKEAKKPPVEGHGLTSSVGAVAAPVKVTPSAGQQPSSTFSYAAVAAASHSSATGSGDMLPLSAPVDSISSGESGVFLAAAQSSSRLDSSDLDGLCSEGGSQLGGIESYLSSQADTSAVFSGVGGADINDGPFRPTDNLLRGSGSLLGDPTSTFPDLDSGDDHLIMFGDLNVSVGGTGMSSLAMGGGMDPSYVPYGGGGGFGAGDAGRRATQSRLMRTMGVEGEAESPSTGGCFGDAYGSEVGGGYDHDIHMMHAEMLLGDDDDDVVDSSREAADLVEFLQETGSIVALVERLGFRKGQTN
jgi:hypothetical protein